MQAATSPGGRNPLEAGVATCVWRSQLGTSFVSFGYLVKEIATVFTLNTKVAFLFCVNEAVLGGLAVIGFSVISSLRQRTFSRHSVSLRSHTYNLTVWEVGAGGVEFKASLGDVRHYLKKKKRQTDSPMCPESLMGTGTQLAPVEMHGLYIVRDSLLLCRISLRLWLVLASTL